MWVFGYGSLMWDGWEKSHECLQHVKANLAGFRRSFNKLSVKRWGTKEHPCPTLNLEASPLDNCTGIAFEFPDYKGDGVLQYLKEREGQNFKLLEHNIRLETGQEITAIVPIYESENLFKSNSLGELATMVHNTTGIEGSCIDYVTGLINKLSELSVDDLNVEEFWYRVKQIEDDANKH